eukprot:2187291-Prymnesium_polylepis.1
MTAGPRVWLQQLCHVTRRIECVLCTVYASKAPEDGELGCAGVSAGQLDAIGDPVEGHARRVDRAVGAAVGEDEAVLLPGHLRSRPVRAKLVPTTSADGSIDHLDGVLVV